MKKKTVNTKTEIKERKKKRHERMKEGEKNND